MTTEGDAAHDIMAQLDRLAPPQGAIEQPESDASKGLPDSYGTGWSLRLRLLAIVIGLLLPLVVLIIVQGVDRARREIADSRVRLAQTASTAAGPEQNILGVRREQILHRALANMGDVRHAMRRSAATISPRRCMGFPSSPTSRVSTRTER